MRQNVQQNEVAALARQLPEKCNKRLCELTDDLRLLVVSHMPLAYAMAWRMKDCNLELDDLRQEGLLGLCEAALRYNEQTGSTFATYASHWCRKMMLLAIHRQRIAGAEADKPLQEQADDEEDLLHTAQRYRIDKALECLSNREQQVVTQFYGLNDKRLDIMEIANRLGISRTIASKLHQRALRKLEAALRDRPLVDYLTPWLE